MLVLVVVMKFETLHLYNWLLYHVHLGVGHFVIISNECDDRAHEELLRVAATVPCSPRLTFMHAFRCDVGFQIRAYTEAVRLLVHGGERHDARVGFWDVDEFLVAPRDGKELGLYRLPYAIPRVYEGYGYGTR